MKTDPLEPVRITPPPRPLGTFGFIRALLRNPMLVAPEPVYEHGVVRQSTPLGPIVWITEPAVIKSVLLDRCEAFPKSPLERRLLGPLFGLNSIMMSEGAEWKWQRQTVAPLFRHADLLSFIPLMTASAEGIIAEWRTAAPGAVRRIDRDMSRVTVKAISDAILHGGNDFIGTMVEQAQDDYFGSISWAAAHAFLKVPDWLPHPGRASMMHAVDCLQAAVRDLVTARRAALADGDDLLGRLVRAREPETGRPISDEQLTDNLIAFFITGFETTALALMWALYLLARAPDWESRMLEEIAQVLNGAAVTGEHIDRLIVTQQILKEAMRLYPPAPAIIRVAREDTTLEGERLAAGTLLIVSIYALHRNKKRWRDPDRFDPSRFAPGSDREIPRYQYMPFGAGPRICIGAALAMIESTAMLATIIRAARFETVPEHVPMPDWRVSLRAKGGMPLRVWMRPAQSSRP